MRKMMRRLQACFAVAVVVQVLGCTEAFQGPGTIYLAPRVQKGVLRCALARKKSSCSLQCSAGSGGGETETQRLFREAMQAKVAADAAAARAAALKQKAGGSATGTRPAAAQPQARSAAEALKNLASPPVETKEQAPDDSLSSPEGEAKTKFTRKFVEAEIQKPMGLVLEENHPSLKVVQHLPSHHRLPLAVISGHFFLFAY